MTENEFLQLLYRGESESLDFKSEQYAFVGASEAKKAQLLKDILAFANAWRNDPAYMSLLTINRFCCQRHSYSP